MKLLTFWNVAGLGLTLVGVSIIVDTLPGSGSSALAQSTATDNISAMIQQISPEKDRPSIQSLSQLLRVGERSYKVNFDESVSTQILSSNVIRKIEFGKESLVSVVSTPSGIYSTDGLASKNILYPGVEVVETTPKPRKNSLDRIGFSGNSTGISPRMTPQHDNWVCITEASFIYCSWR